MYSCGDLETVVDLKIPEHNPVLVVNSSVQTNSKIKVFVSHSLDAFGTNIPSNIDDATVLLYEDNRFVDSLFTDFSDSNYLNYFNGRTIDTVLIYYYKTDLEAIANKSYRLEVSHPAYPSVSGSTIVPSGVDITLLPSVSDEQIKFSFNDDPSVENFYELKVFIEGFKEFEGEIISYRDRLEFASNDVSFPNEVPFNGFTFYGRKVLFDDALFNGSEKQISIEIVSDYYEDIIGENDTIYFQLTELSSEAFSYYNTRNSQIEDGAAGIFGGEVIPVFSNIDSGLGVFISLNSQSVIVE